MSTLTMLHTFERESMRTREIVYVNIVPDTGSIRRRIILPEHLQTASSKQSAKDVWDQMSFWFVGFANVSIGTRTSSIEVAKRNGTQSVCNRGISQKALDH